MLVRVIQREESQQNIEVRLIDGEESKIVNIKEAYKQAQESSLDLVEMNASSSPIVVKIFNFGKIAYEKKKKLKQGKTKSKKSKEIRFHTNITPHDYGIKLKHIIEFLKKGHVVKISLDYRGREMAHLELGKKLLDKLIDETADYSKVESRPEMQGRRASVIISPKKG
jgi:translation initiation factor IF-3